MIQSQEQGFTLVELAISLMIIGLLIAGVLKGQELIANAKTTSAMRQIDAYKTAISIFRSTYRSLPGDIKTPGTRIPDCTTAPCNTAGNGDSIFGLAVPTINADPYGYGGGSEAQNFFLHLAKAGLITGITMTYTGTPRLIGQDVPGLTGDDEKGIYVATLGIGGAPIPQLGNYFITTNQASLTAVSSLGNSNDVFTASAAGQIDRKMDDGLPTSGDINYGGHDCVNSSNEYDEANKSARCNLVFNMGQ